MTDKEAFRLRRIYDRTTGYCHLCGKKLSFINYDQAGRRGSWHIEHSKPRCRGGTDRLCNLYAACIECNRDKSDFTTRTARRWNGRVRAPLSRSKRSGAKAANTLAGAAAGFVLGSLFGPLGRVIGAVAGAQLGNSRNPDNE